MVRQKYRKPPIQEAICQLVLASPLPWSITTAGELFARFRDRYPGDPSQQQQIEANIVTGAAVADGSPLKLVQSPVRLQFKTKDGTRLLTIGSDLIAIHTLDPYIGFEEELLPRVKQDMADLAKGYDIEGVTKVSLRYINNVQIPGETIKLESYFSYSAFNAIDDLPFKGTVHGFLYRTQLAGLDAKTGISLTIGSLAPKEEGAAGVLLDIDVTRNVDGAFDVPSITKDLVELKALENEVFESLITDECRELFK